MCSAFSEWINPFPTQKYALRKEIAGEAFCLTVVCFNTSNGQLQDNSQNEVVILQRELAFAAELFGHILNALRAVSVALFLG